MEEVFVIFVSIISLFLLLLVVKQFLPQSIKERLCVLCAGVSLTWIALLVFYYLGVFESKILIALLMGNTMLGIFYLVEKKVQEELKVFRLPFYLTLLFIAVGLLQIQVSFGVVVLLGAVWAVFLGLYLFKQNATVHRTVKKIIECCKNW